MKNNKLTLKDVSAELFLDEIKKQLKKYEKENSHMNIMTCDISDVYDFLYKAEKKSIKKSFK
jgi:hypothetical protein